MLVANIWVMMAPGRREQTHARLLACALDLFEQQGFDQTTVAQIARAAGVTEMTVFRHFPTKEGLLLDDPYDPVMAVSVAAQPRSLSPLARAVAGIRHAWRQLPQPESQTVRRRVRVAAASPSVRAGIAANNGRTEHLLAEQLIADGADPLPARVAAAAVMAGITAALLEWSQHEQTTLADAVDAALDTLDTVRG